MPPNRKIFGCFTRKERWGLSARGWLAGIVILLGLAGLWILNIYPFLAQMRPADTKVLVVEGWVREFAIQDAVTEFQTGHYKKVYTTGGPIAGSGGYSNDYNTAASVGADLLVKDGLPSAVVQMVPSHVSGRDRTYSSALKLREYFQTNGIAIKSFNIVTEGAHARRTRLLFQEAFGPGVTVGVIAVRDPDFEPERWWHYSEGVREVIGESIAWVYAAFLFHPDREPAAPAQK